MTPIDEPRPEGPADMPAANVISGRILRTAYLGSVTLYDVGTAKGTSGTSATFKIARPNGERMADPNLPAGAEVWLSWAATAPVVLLS